MLDPIVKTVEVPCGQQEAFEVFVLEMGTWWPVAHFSVSAMSGQLPAALRVESVEGGSIVEIGPDGTEHVWGTITTYDPHDYLAMNFHIPEATDPADASTVVEVRFSPVAEERTRVELTQSNWESLGDRAAAKHGGYGAGWDMILGQAYAAACGQHVGGDAPSDG